MILCLDAGNSRLKWGSSKEDASGWLAQGALDYADLARLPAQLHALPHRIVACNVAGESVAESIEHMATDMGMSVQWLTSSEAACGVTNRYATPSQLGADRWAALIGARALGFGPAIVVMAGTATTIDVLDTEGGVGVFRGGLILSGLHLMRTSLARGTADLPLVTPTAGHYQRVPNTTENAIVSGSLHATLGAIDRMRVVLEGDVAVVLSGGGASELQAHLAPPVKAVENLVLEGLLCFARATHPAPT